MVVEPNIAPVDEREEKTAEDERQFIEMEAVEKIDQPTPEAEVPKNDGNDDLSLQFRKNPLNEESGGKDELTDDANDSPDDGFHVKPWGDGF